MFARQTSFKVDPARVRDTDLKLRAMFSGFSLLPGIRAKYLIWRADGRGTVIALFQSRAAAVTADLQAEPIWQELAAILEEGPVAEDFDTVTDLI